MYLDSLYLPHCNWCTPWITKQFRARWNCDSHQIETQNFHSITGRVPTIILQCLVWAWRELKLASGFRLQGSCYGFRYVVEKNQKNFFTYTVTKSKFKWSPLKLNSSIHVNILTDNDHLPLPTVSLITLMQPTQLWTQHGGGSRKWWMTVLR
jgi:hypothetical protein